MRRKSCIWAGASNTNYLYVGQLFDTKYMTVLFYTFDVLKQFYNDFAYLYCILVNVPYSYIYGTGTVNMDDNKVGIF